MAIMDEGEFVPLGEAAERVGVEVGDVVDLVFARQIPVLRRPNGRPLVDPADVARILDVRPAPTSS
jgi:hypothetical protein